MAKFDLGQKVYFVPYDRRSTGGGPRELSIVAIGRKWATLDNGFRMDSESMRIDGRGYSSPGQCYLSKEQYDAYKSAEDAWVSLKSWLAYKTRPDNVTENDIKQAGELLGKEAPHEAQ